MIRISNQKQTVQISVIRLQGENSTRKKRLPNQYVPVELENKLCQKHTKNLILTENKTCGKAAWDLEAKVDEVFGLHYSTLNM